MSRVPAHMVFCLLAAAGIFFFSGAQAIGAKAENRLFMREFSRYAIGMLDEEPAVRETIRNYLKENRDRVREGFGSNPELISRLNEKLGLERMNCIRGRYYGELSARLNNEERHLFYENGHRLNWWVLMIAVEEADALGIRKTSPPLNFRQPSDVPFYISKTIREELAPFAQAKLTAEDMKGFGYEDLPCR